MNADRFAELVEEALAELPASIRQKLDNVVVTVAEWPSREELADAGTGPGRTLFGLYKGVPHTKRSSHYGMVVPDHVTIFQGPIMRVCGTAQEVKDEVRRVVLHELGHHFGISEDRLRELGL